MEVVEKKEMVHKDVYESGEKEYASKGVAGTGLGLGIAGTALGLLLLAEEVYLDLEIQVAQLLVL